MRRYHDTTFGCQMNAHDSERIRGTLEELGLGEAPSFEEADVLVFNTCTIREKPDQRLAAHLGNASAAKARNPETIVAVNYGGPRANDVAIKYAALAPDDAAGSDRGVEHRKMLAGHGSLRRFQLDVVSLMSGGNMGLEIVAIHPKPAGT